MAKSGSGKFRFRWASWLQSGKTKASNSNSHSDLVVVGIIVTFVVRDVVFAHSIWHRDKKAGKTRTGDQ